MADADDPSVAKFSTSSGLLTTMGQDFAYLSRGIGFGSLRAPDESSSQPATVRQIQKRPHEAGCFGFGCGDRI
ncbi:MAG: hypothetical protein E5X76_28570 [Mesorhizobium sp.]|nr:MAG: hypothetical protein E5X76_28570 [Mesorhizobium sp.]